MHDQAASFFPPSIGVFDSGVGGLTVLRELRRRMPQVPLRYVADAAYTPYGEKKADFIVQRSLVIGEHLRARGAQLLVVACNTATAHAIDAMRLQWPGMPIVGTEPGVKPAVAASRNGRVGVLATPATIASARYQSLLSRHAGGAQIISQPCPGLADLIEQGELDSTALRQLVSEQCAPLRAAGVDTVLMGCTHYPLIQPLLQDALGAKVKLLNIESAVAQQAERLWAELGLISEGDSISLQSTGNADALTRFVHAALGWPGLQAEQLTTT